MTWTLLLLAALAGGLVVWMLVGRRGARGGNASAARTDSASDPESGSAVAEWSEDPPPRQPLGYEIDPVSRLVTIDYHAYPSFEEWSAMMESIFADPRYQIGFNFLFNRSTVHDAQSTVYIRHVSDFVMAHQQQLLGSRMALVVTNLASYGMGRMSGQLIERAPVEQAVFSDVTKALAWLNQDRGAH
jgi:hypothetical protein